MDVIAAYRKFNESRRFPVHTGKLVIREVALAAEIAAVKAERRQYSGGQVRGRTATLPR